MREIDQPDRPGPSAPSAMGLLDIELSSLDMLGYDHYRPRWDRGDVMDKVTNLLTESERTNQMHLVRIFTPQEVCMVLSLFRSQGQGKIFEIFSGGHCGQEPDEDCIEPDDDGFNRVSEVLVLIHKDYCPNLYAFLGVEPSEHHAKILFSEVGDEEYKPEFFFCNWIASGASEGFTSITCRPDNVEGLLHFGALVVAIVKCIMGISLGDESSGSTIVSMEDDPPRGRFEFFRHSADSDSEHDSEHERKEAADAYGPVMGIAVTDLIFDGHVPHPDDEFSFLISVEHLIRQSTRNLRLTRHFTTTHTGQHHCICLKLSGPANENILWIFVKADDDEDHFTLFIYENFSVLQEFIGVNPTERDHQFFIPVYDTITGARNDVKAIYGMPTNAARNSNDERFNFDVLVCDARGRNQFDAAAHYMTQAIRIILGLGDE